MGNITECCPFFLFLEVGMKRLFLLLLWVPILIYNTNSQEQIKIRLNLFGNDTLVFNKLDFGFINSATNGLDTSLGEVDLPPFVPPSGYGIYGVFVFYDSASGGNIWSYSDWRPFPSNLSDTVKFLLYVFRESGIKLKISWFGLNDYFRSAWFVDEYLGTLVQVNMLETNYVSVTNEFLDKFYIKVVLNPITNVEDLNEDSEVTIRQFTDKILLVSRSNEVCNYGIFDIFGNLISKGIFVNKIHVGISNFPKGVYFVKIENQNNKSVLKKILIY